MWSRVLSFGVGALLLRFLPTLPSPLWSLLVLLVSLLLARWRWFRLLPWLLAGFSWALLYASWLLSMQLPMPLEGQDLLVDGVVVSLPDSDGRRTRFELDVGHAQSWLRPGRLRLSWYKDVPTLLPGQHWQLLVRLKRPRGFANPGGFDYAGWLFRNGIAATGYVRRSAENRLLGMASLRGGLTRWRQQIATAIQQQSENDAIGALLRALAVGDRSGMSAPQWQLLSATGTNHLMAISGLHIGLVAALGFFLGRWLWSLPAVTVLWLPAAMPGALGALLAAGFYATLAGWSLPTQRAFVMVAVVMVGVFSRRRIGLPRGLLLALAAVLLIDPLAPLEPGFWLSFGAVGLLLYGMRWRPREGGWWWRWGRAQWLIALGLFPLLALLFQKVSLIAPLANLVAIPWVSFIVVPPLLAAVLLLSVWPLAAHWLLGLAAASLQWLWRSLDWLAGLPMATWQLPQLPWSVVAMALLGVLLLLAPRGLPGRWWGALGLLPLLLYQPPRPPPGEAWFTLLDVGHGLAAVVQTRAHTLIFDTGPRYGGSFDAGSTAIVPLLRRDGVDKVDVVVISHGDSDHMGGLRSLQRAVPLRRIISGVAGRIEGAEPCQAGQHWVWDGVRFDMLHPGRGAGWAGNDGSCVLRVASAVGSVLIPGDIEAAGEADVLRRLGAGLRSDVLVAAHHGSHSSSTAAFIDAVDPAYVLFPAGYRDRYGHPHADVLRRFRERSVKPLQTASDGAIRVRLPARGALPQPCAWRAGRRPFWQWRARVPGTALAWSECRDAAE